jgi:hypothetical protein
MEVAETTELTTRKSKITFHKMSGISAEGLSAIASSDNREDAEDSDGEQAEQGQPTEDDEHDWVMGTITKTAQENIQRFWQTQMKPDKFTQPRCEEPPDYFCEREYKYGTLKLCIPAVIQLQTDDNVVPPAPTTFVELMEHLEIVPRVSGMPQGTSRPPNSHRRIHF